MVGDGQMAHVHDIESDAGVPTLLRDLARLRGFRAMLLAPLVRDTAVIGMISVTRQAPGPFAEHHVQLLRTFADQAVIAIQNARLFNETSEALERQTATADILKVIASSPDDVQPVFEAIARRARALCDAVVSGVSRFDGEWVHLAAVDGVTPDAIRRRLDQCPGDP
jgi:two-component system NtrC family sensor kinase